MPAYLSDEWVRSLDEALDGVAPGGVAPGGGGSATPGRAVATTTVQFEVVGGPSGGRCWHLTLGPTGARAVPGPADEPTVTFTQGWSTALAVARGRRGAQEALLAGEVRVGGDPTRLVPWRRGVQEVEEAMAQLNASTSFPPEPPPPLGGADPLDPLNPVGV
jgi:hypothetical protein